ncbi:Hypothetical protein PaelaDRAFT_4663 [Paenibacillus lactis 154]|uniref:Uncharacterized protein n=1 Tax=Paenibacillus lactis 154 TaxID=743719 RepID=G4HL02_9BACL|nr:Hypothetical protein PaelaDRAFT_4663 [Paenibacillus lactis 154]
MDIQVDKEKTQSKRYGIIVIIIIAIIVLFRLFIWDVYLVHSTREAVLDGLKENRVSDYSSI